jgi:hypothetical protein
MLPVTQRQLIGINFGLLRSSRHLFLKSFYLSIQVETHHEAGSVPTGKRPISSAGRR